jgi:hypothetical protein
MRTIVEPREIVESVLGSLIAQQAQPFIAWFDDNVLYEVPPQPPTIGRFRYFQEIALLLTPGSGARASGFRIDRVEPPGQRVRWVQTSLDFEMTADGSVFPAVDAPLRQQNSEVWFGVRDDKIVEVKAFSRSQSWHASG